MILIFGWAVDGAAQSTRFPGQLGSMPYADAAGTGVTFRVWAPNASSVTVRGDFNGWGQTALLSEGGGAGHWSMDVPGAQAGQNYRYYLNGNTWKRDPRSRRVTNSGSNGNSTIYDPDAFNWGTAPTPQPWRNDLVLYQMHVGTFEGGNPPRTFDHAIARLDHVKQLGVSAIQLMPINEFAGSHSWGYNPADLFAVESAYGGPDAFKRFIRACHERGMAVFVDVVHNHYGPSDLATWRFDGWFQNNLGGIYFYNDNRAYTAWGNTRPDFGRAEVRSFIRDQALMYVQEYRVGGFRWDSVYNIINTDQGANVQGRQMVTDINWELSQTHPHVVRIAEDHAFDFSMNFESQWDVGYRWDLHGQVVNSSDSARNMNTVAGLLANWGGHHRVVFSEAHDYIARVHSRSRIPSEVDSANPDSIWARKRALLAGGIVLTTPGIPMIFQGQEMHETLAFHDDTALRWTRTNTYAGIVKAYADLIHARRNLRGGLQGLKGTGVHVHHVDNGNKVIGFIRWDAGGQTDDVVVIANFAATLWTNSNYVVQFPSAGTWYRHFNSDATLYQPDFGNIGPTQVVAAGSPPAAAVNMGMYALQIFSKTAPDDSAPPPAAPSSAHFDPASPTGCVDVVVTYEAGEGPLQFAADVFLHHGRNGWLDAADQPMAPLGGGSWAATVTVEQGTFELNVAFHDGDSLWDSNADQNWSVPFVGCAIAPGLASVDPEFPQTCDPVTILYKENGGPLAGAGAVHCHLGHNNWLNVVTVPMTNLAGDLWSAEYALPLGTWQLDFVFHNGADEAERVWDNNQWKDWHTYVNGCLGAEGAGLIITNPVADLIVPYDEETFPFNGAALNMEGDLFWENTRTGDSGWIPADTNWAVDALPLEVGANLFRITGMSSPVNPNDKAGDSATNSLYTGVDAWISGQNGGQQWGGGWSLVGGTNAGHFLGQSSSLPNLTISPRGWGLWANSGGVSEAIRPLAGPLRVGDVLSARFQNYWIDAGGTVGVGLRNGFGQSLFEFYFVGGGANYRINDALTDRDTGIPWTPDGLELVFELITPTTYRFTVNGQEITGALATTSEALVRQFRVWNFNAGPWWERNVYLTDLAIHGEPLESQEHAAERTIHRRFGPHFLFAPSEGEAGWRLTFPLSEIGQVYEVYSSTNLLGPEWTPLGYNLPGDGFPLQLLLTNQADVLHFRTSIRPAE
jgi:1,4-alpha-glucan branching enzyme